MSRSSCCVSALVISCVLRKIASMIAIGVMRNQSCCMQLDLGMQRAIAS
jgi:hypothetical protein